MNGAFLSTKMVMFLKITLKFLVSYLCIGFGGICNIDKSLNKSTEKNAFLDYNNFADSHRLKMKEKAKEMFYFGYDNYIKYAFPLDELNPIHCEGRGPDKKDPDNININDVLGGYSLTLIDTLDTLAVMGNHTEFKHAVKLIMDYVTFDSDNIVQVFEATIRVLGGLLAAHLLIVDPLQTFGPLEPKNYDNELLSMAHDLANRLLPAFETSSTGIPWPRINLRHGVPENCSSTTCTAGAGTLLLEFGILSSILGDPTLESTARAALDALWKFRSNKTGLFGNVINVQTGEWVGRMSGLGAGVDSFYEYLLKSYILFGRKEDLNKFNSVYDSIIKYMRKGRKKCNDGSGATPLHVNVDMNSGEIVNTWIDSLQASFTGVQVLRGDIEEAICSHAVYYAIWQRYGALPERFNWKLKRPDVKFYPLRPEFSEATYLLYQATKHPFYLHVGEEILASLDAHTRAACGFATLHDVDEKSQEDRMESFFLSETMKYLYLLFDFENPVNQEASKWIFSTEGHIFKLDESYRQMVDSNENNEKAQFKPVFSSTSLNSTLDHCSSYKDMKYSRLPMREEYFSEVEKFVGFS